MATFTILQALLPLGAVRMRALKRHQSQHPEEKLSMASYALPPPSWKGWRALLLILAAPLLYKTTAALTVVASTLLFGGVSAERRYEGLAIYENQ